MKESGNRSWVEITTELDDRARLIALKTKRSKKALYEYLIQEGIAELEKAIKNK